MIAGDSLGRVLADAAGHGAQPLWTVMDAMVPPRPAPKAVPYVWRYAELRPLLGRAATLVDTHDAERRVFMLVNPALRAPYTTDTVYAGLQLINPGEIACAHRHVAFALRFVVEGDGAYTAVGDEQVTMHRGDLVLTPSWEMHQHGHEGEGPMVWLDGLDLPLWQFFPANFAERAHEERQPAYPADAASHLRFPWAAMQTKLDAQPGPFARAGYRRRDDGAPVSRTLGASAERIAARARSATRRETASAVYHVYAGSGRTRIGAEVVRWTQGDTFCVPAWSAYAHEADETAYLFRFDDRPMLEALGAYRCEEPSA